MMPCRQVMSYSVTNFRFNFSPALGYLRIGVKSRPLQNRNSDVMYKSMFGNCPSPLRRCLAMRDFWFTLFVLLLPARCYRKWIGHYVRRRPTIYAFFLRSSVWAFYITSRSRLFSAYFSNSAPNLRTFVVWYVLRSTVSWVRFVHLVHYLG